MCSLDILETARVALGFGETIWKSMSAGNMAAGTVFFERTGRVKHAFDRATDAGGRALDDERVAVGGDEGDVFAFFGHGGVFLCFLDGIGFWGSTSMLQI